MELYCIEDICTDVAIAERLVGITSDGDEIVELVCYEHAQTLWQEGLEE